MGENGSDAPRKSDNDTLRKNHDEQNQKIDQTSNEVATYRRTSDRHRRRKHKTRQYRERTKALCFRSDTRNMESCIFFGSLCNRCIGIKNVCKWHRPRRRVRLQIEHSLRLILLRHFSTLGRPERDSNGVYSGTSYRAHPELLRLLSRLSRGRQAHARAYKRLRRYLNIYDILQRMGGESRGVRRRKEG